jgi:hypothetical protein
MNPGQKVRSRPSKCYGAPARIRYTLPERELRDAEREWLDDFEIRIVKTTSPLQLFRRTCDFASNLKAFSCHTLGSSEMNSMRELEDSSTTLQRRGVALTTVACGCWWTDPDRLLLGRLQRDYRAILTPK